MTNLYPENHHECDVATGSAEIKWHGDVVRGSGRVTAGSGSFSVGATFPTIRASRQE